MKIVNCHQFVHCKLCFIIDIIPGFGDAAPNKLGEGVIDNDPNANGAAADEVVIDEVVVGDAVLGAMGIIDGALVNAPATGVVGLAT